MSSNLSDNIGLREEILIATHRWPTILLYGLVGLLLGWLVSWIWPSPYRATKELYVGLNIYPEFSGLQFTNADDYKNWQMANLNSLVLLDSVVDDTLVRLQRSDPYWQEIGREELAGMLHIYWRNAGKWRLVAEHNDPSRAMQAVTNWEQVAIERIHFAISQAQNSMLLELRLSATIDLQTQMRAHIAELTQDRKALLAWHANLSQLPPDQLVTQTQHSQILALLQLLGANPGVQSTSPGGAPHLDAFPVPTPAQAYILPLEQAIAALDQEIQASQAAHDALEHEVKEIAQSYTTASENSLGISANMVVDSIADKPRQLTIVRPTGILALVGALLGLIILAIGWLANAARSGPDGSADKRLG